MRLRVGLAVGLVVLASAAVARDVAKPAELPSASYGGQQYVDSRGCVFLRAGTAAEVRWVPRVTRDGVPVCGYPPSGNRVAAVGEGVAGAAVPQVAAVPDVEVAAPVVAEKLLVAIGSFSDPGNADRAVRSMVDLGLSVMRGKIERSGVVLHTVFAGPFASTATATTALAKVRSAGFPDAVIMRQ